MSIKKFTEKAISILEAEFEMELLNLVSVIPSDYWEDISCSPKLTLGIINRHPELPWDWCKIGMIPCITIEFVMEHLDKFKTTQQIFQSTWFYISKNPNITWDIVTQYSSLPWRWDGLSQNPSITMDIVLQNISSPWIWKDLSYNASGTLTIEIVLANIKKSWDWSQLSRNLPLSADILERYPDLPWNWTYMSANKRFTSDFWNKEMSSFNENINVSEVSNNIFSNVWSWFSPIKKNSNILRPRGWDWNYFLNSNDSIPIKTIIENTNYPWNWRVISCRTDLTWDMIISNLNLPWDWIMLSSNEAITWDIVRDNPQFDWDYAALSSNPNITYENLKEHLTSDESLGTYLLHNSGVAPKDPSIGSLVLSNELRCKKLMNPMYVGNNRFIDSYVAMQLSREVAVYWLTKVSLTKQHVDIRLFDKIAEYL